MADRVEPTELQPGEVYVGYVASAAPTTRSQGLRSRDLSLDRVKIKDEELELIRQSAARIVDKLGSTDPSDHGLQVSTITLHLGLSASAHIFFIAEPEINAPIEFTWERQE